MLLDGLQEVLEIFVDIMGDLFFVQELMNFFKVVFEGKMKYGEVVFDLIYCLFGEYGFVILDFSYLDLKVFFIFFVYREIFEQFFKLFVEGIVKELEVVGFLEQVYFREINFFYLGEGFWECIVQEGEIFKVFNQDILWIIEVFRVEIEVYLQWFSFNVVMWLIYQEYILFNLVYIGGGGEIVYWLE